jgi:hypothetical protein
MTPTSFMSSRHVFSFRQFSLVLLASPLLGFAGPGEDFFTQKVQAVLEQNCVSCHGPEKSKGKLQLHTLELMLKGGAGGPVLTVSKPQDSPLVTRTKLAPTDEEIMPPTDKGGPLAAEEIAILEKWVAEGAVWPAGVTLAAKEKPAAPPKESLVKVRKMTVYPDTVTLETKRDTHRMLAVATFDDDVTQEVTAKATYTLADPSIAKLEGQVLHPLKNGETKMTISWHDQKLEIPVTVKGVETDRPASFVQDVMPIFMRANCNTGSCHGAARGQDGFNLSLFGFDPRGDHFRITQQLSGRRINLGLPEDSLLVTKAIGEVPHTGGDKVKKGSDSHKMLLEWIGLGAPLDPTTVATPVKVEIYPKQAVLEGIGTKQQFTVRATFSDGHDRDVTDLVVFMSNNDPVAAMAPEGKVTAQKRGEAFVMARYETFTVGSQVLVIPDKLQYQKPEYPPVNYVDELVAAKLHKLRILPSGLCNDATFLRRSYLDIAGMLPSEEEHAKFLADTSQDKRLKLVDELIGRKEFTDMWVMKFAELLQIRTNATNQVSYKSTLLYFNWLKEKIADNVPFNKIVQEIISSSGGTFTSPATNYYQIERDTLKVSENVAQVFMGMRLQCAQCHNHPFDRWTMNDYYGFASFFTQIGRKQAEDPRETVVFNAGGGEFNHPVTKTPVPPKFLGGDAPKLDSDRRKIVAEWLASPQNPYFAKNLSNIVWSHFFGQGIIEPVDDVRISNPASNPELLEELGKKLTEYNYDFKRFVRDICTSRTYSLATQVNESNAEDERNFSHSYVRRQRAEVMLDTLSQVTCTPNKFQGLPMGARAVQIADGNVSTYFLKTFGRAERATVCSCEVKMDPSLSQALHLLNGDITHNRIGQGGLVKKLLDEKKTPEQIVESLYIRTCSRKPNENEIKPVQAAIAAEPNEVQSILEDVFWALLNSKEFMFNH